MAPKRLCLLARLSSKCSYKKAVVRSISLYMTLGKIPPRLPILVGELYGVVNLDKDLHIVLKDLNGITAFMYNLIIEWYWENLRLSIYTELDKRDDNFDNLSAVVQQFMNAKASATWQDFWFIWKSNMWYLIAIGYRKIMNQNTGQTLTLI